MLTLKDGQRQALLRRARQSIASVFDPGIFIEPLEDPLFSQKRGLFVTLTLSGELKGCIGFITGVEPLKDAVIHLAREAAFHDPRFEPLRREELDDVAIEISLLSPLKRITDLSGIRTGRDGLVVRNGSRSGLLLPQVAVEYHWGREEFIGHTCRKAGLPPEAASWPETEIYSFTAEIFSEKDRDG
ncbi:AmmeMemoRadiSam system protein A [Candidatus Mcinerneyibacteriota bacterium]|nr:AmmeMemoRadiSam system protein A [Candidatus Mcinerneyibacteriota bacterium]